MNINDFINEYNQSVTKEDFVKKHIVNYYVPYERKMVLCRNIVKNADYTIMVDDIQKSYYSPNTPMRFLLFCVTLIDEYTDIELDLVEEGRDVIGGFNKLDQKGIFEIIISELNREYNIFKTVLDMIVNDTECKENNIVGFLNTKFDSIKILYDTIVPVIENKLSE